MKIERIYHHWEKWEDYKAGFYNNMAGVEKEEKRLKVIEMFINPDITKEYMRRAIETWYYSCQQNLTNNGMNKIAYIGQAACCLYADVPSTVTMEVWSDVPKEYQDIADKIATEILIEWEQKHIKELIMISNDNKC